MPADHRHAAGCPDGPEGAAQSVEQFGHTFDSRLEGIHYFVHVACLLKAAPNLDVRYKPTSLGISEPNARQIEGRSCPRVKAGEHTTFDPRLDNSALNA